MDIIFKALKTEAKREAKTTGIAVIATSRKSILIGMRTREGKVAADLAARSGW